MAKKKQESWSLQRVMQELKSLGNEQTVNTFRRHGADGDIYGVKIGDLKKIIPHIKDNQSIALELWDTNNSDAMYLASLIADGSQMTKRQLDHWVKTAWWNMLSEHCVPTVAAQHDDAFAIGTKWMGRKQLKVITSGWATYSMALSVRPDDEIDLGEVVELLEQCKKEIHDVQDRVRLSMNGFVISVGCYVSPLSDKATATAKAIGKVEACMGDTSCKIPLATEYIAKVKKMGRVGKKRASTKC